MKAYGKTLFKLQTVQHIESSHWIQGFNIILIATFKTSRSQQSPSVGVSDT